MRTLGVCVLVLMSCGEPNQVVPEPDEDGGTDAGGGTCTNTQTDNRNCGACGHDCAGAACVDGLCEPVVLAEAGVGGVAALDPLYSDGTSVYFGSTGSVCSPSGSCHTFRKCNGAGCGMNPFVLCSDKAPGTSQKFTGGGGTAYWFESYARLGLVSCDLAGGNGSNAPVVWSSTQTASYGASLATDATNVYWTHLATNTIYSCPRSGCVTPTAIATVPNGQSLAMPIVADGGNVYFVSNTTIYRVPADGSSMPTMVVSGLTGINGITTDANNVYWAGASGDVGSCSKSGCAAGTTLTSLSLPVANVVVDSGRIYWSQRGRPSEIGRCTLPSCDDALVLARNPDRGMPGIAVDATSLYFGDGALKRVPK